MSNRVVEVFSREYWTCNNPQHRHMTEAVATACIDRESRPKRITNKWDVDLYARVLLQRRQGLTFKEIGSGLGVSAQRAREAVMKAERIERRNLFITAVAIADATVVPQ